MANNCGTDFEEWKCQIDIWRGARSCRKSRQWNVYVHQRIMFQPPFCQGTRQQRTNIPLEQRFIISYSPSNGKRKIQDSDYVQLNKATKYLHKNHLATLHQQLFPIQAQSKFTQIRRGKTKKALLEGPWVLADFPPRLWSIYEIDHPLRQPIKTTGQILRRMQNSLYYEISTVISDHQTFLMLSCIICSMFSQLLRVRLLVISLLHTFDQNKSMNLNFIISPILKMQNLILQPF